MNSFAERKVENGAQRYTPQNYSVLVYATIKKNEYKQGGISGLSHFYSCTVLSNMLSST